MAVVTTTIGAFPKPSYVELPDWFAASTTGTPNATIATSQLIVTEALEAAIERGTREVVKLQVDAGIDIPTDGEVRRENYVHYHCRQLDGIDFDRLTEKTVRNGSWKSALPTVVGRITPRTSFLDRDYRTAQAATPQPVKMTMPGPLTIMDTTADAFYGSDEAWGQALAAALNQEVRALVAAGCTQIQIDEPVFARYPDAARRFGFDLLEMVVDGVPAEVTTTLHICCGYPDRLDNPDYPKADPSAYLALAPDVENSAFDAVSLEDAHRANPIELFAALSTTTVVLGSVQVASSRVETADEIAARIEAVLDVLPVERLVLAPDCGLGMLPTQIALDKLTNLCRAAQRFTAEPGGDVAT